MTIQEEIIKKQEIDILSDDDFKIEEWNKTLISMNNTIKESNDFFDKIKDDL